MEKSELRCIALLTDFGLEDIFVGVLKGVIASISSDIHVVDLSHGVDHQNFSHGSFLLKASYSYFPRKTVFCVVVDPGVGSDRMGICIETQDYFFVGPDNGVLWSAACENGIKNIVKLENPVFFLDSVSNTFHGRDIFAPVAAHIAKGMDDITILGSELKECCKLDLPAIGHGEGTLTLSVIDVDHFGNITLNLTHEQFEDFVQKRAFALEFKEYIITKVYDNYSMAAESELFLVRASNGFMEISRKNSNAAEAISAELADTITVKLLS